MQIIYKSRWFYPHISYHSIPYPVTIYLHLYTRLHTVYHCLLYGIPENSLRIQCSHTLLQFLKYWCSMHSVQCSASLQKETSYYEINTFIRNYKIKFIDCSYTMFKWEWYFKLTQLNCVKDPTNGCWGLKIPLNTVGVIPRTAPKWISG